MSTETQNDDDTYLGPIPRNGYTYLRPSRGWVTLKKPSAIREREQAAFFAKRAEKETARLDRLENDPAFALRVYRRELKSVSEFTPFERILELQNEIFIAKCEISKEREDRRVARQGEGN